CETALARDHWPRLAMGRPSISMMSSAKLSAGALAMGDLAALDVGIGGGVKPALRGGRHSLCAPRSTPKVAKSVSEARGQVKLPPSRSGAGFRGWGGVERT